MPTRKAKSKNPVSIDIGNIQDVSGKVTIAGRDVYEGYTAEQVSLLLGQITAKYQRKPFDGRCPYKGLEVFEEEDAELFFGRERLVEDLLSRVKESRTVFITGPSGSGKSSLVRAGLLHALKQGAIKGSNSWLYETMKPGREPIKDLALAFSRLKGPDLADYFQAHAAEMDVLNKCAESALSGRKDQRFVLFVDQFEEVFTQVNQETERLAFLNMLAHAGTVENGRVIVLFAMRSDFVSNCAMHPALNELLSQQFRQIGAMQPEELVSAIALPAKQVGLPIEDELIARIINDMKGEPGALPLMQFALKDLFDSQQAKGGIIALTLEDYLRHGGIQKSLEHHADDSFARLSENEQQLARSIFSGLIEIGRGTQDTRRTALFDELIPANAKATEVESVVQKLADARLIITDEQAGKDTVTISHEKLIEAWPWLKKLVNENRDVIALQNEIASDAKEWEDHGRDASYLYTGARLANAREQLQARKLVLSGSASEFVQAGGIRQRRSQLALIASVSVVILLLFSAVILFRSQAQEKVKIANTAEAARIEADYQAKTAQSMALRERNLALSLLLGIEVFRHEDNVGTRGLLLDNVQFNPQLLQFLRGHDDSVNTVAFSPDGKLLASGSADQTIILWDVFTHEQISQPLSLAGSVNSIAFSPDGTMLAAGTSDKTILLWDMNTHETIGQPLTGHSGPIHSAVFSPDGKILASGDDDGTVILWDVVTRQRIGEPLHASGSVYSLAFSPDGRTLAFGSTDPTITLWDVATHEAIGQPLVGHKGSVYSLAFSPDGKTLASGSNDYAVILWDLNTHQPIGQPLTRHSNLVASLVFSPDGKTLASASYDSTIILWNVATHQRIGQPLRGHSDSVLSVTFSPDGKMLASGGADRTVILWQGTTQQRIDQLIPGTSGSINSLAFSPDGKTLASGNFQNTVTLWDVNTRTPIGQPLKGHAGSVLSVAFSPDGRSLASASADKSIVLWNVATQPPIGQPLMGHTDSINSVAFSPDGKILASGSADKTIILWDVNTHEMIGQPLTGHMGPVYGLAFSPDGKILASASADKTIILWDVAAHERIGQPLSGHSQEVTTVAFRPGGKIIASGSADGTILLWDAATHLPTGQPFKGSTRLVASLAFSPDGAILAAGIHDKTIILWDVNAHRPIGQPLTGHTGSVHTVAFSPDGEMLASGGLDNNIILWDMDPQSWLAKSCQRAGRNFTRVEWRQYFPNDEYRKTCEQWPLEQETSPSPGSTP
jgi:WD40 repeat protein/energy-coupling factor transporter ATP-binding protein EcfA2